MRSLNIKKTNRSSRRKTVGSAEHTTECFDCCADVRLSVRTVKQNLEIDNKVYFAYESHMSIGYAASIFGTPTNESELQYKERMLKRFLENPIT